METSNRLSRPDRLEIFGNDWDDRDDPDDHMETRLYRWKHAIRFIYHQVVCIVPLEEIRS